MLRLPWRCSEPQQPVEHLVGEAAGSRADRDFPVALLCSMTGLGRSASAPAPLPEQPRRPVRSKKEKHSADTGGQHTNSGDTVSGSIQHEGKHIQAKDIEMVQNMIERCLQLYMPRKDVVATLQAQAKIEPGFTNLVWQKLEEQNHEFFEAYYLRLKVKEHIAMFNHLVEQQMAMTQKLHSSWMQAMPSLMARPPFMPGGPLPPLDTSGPSSATNAAAQTPTTQPSQPTSGTNVTAAAGVPAGYPQAALDTGGSTFTLLNPLDPATLDEVLLIEHHPSSSGAQGQPGGASQPVAAADDDGTLHSLLEGSGAEADLIDLIPGWGQAAASHSAGGIMLDEPMQGAGGTVSKNFSMSDLNAWDAPAVTASGAPTAVQHGAAGEVASGDPSAGGKGVGGGGAEEGAGRGMHGVGSMGELAGAEVLGPDGAPLSFSMNDLPSLAAW